MVLPLLESDLLTIMKATTDGTLTEEMVKFREGACACVVMASKGYPQKYETGFEISMPDSVADRVYVAGAKLSDGKLLTAGGRVLGVTGTGDTLPEALKAAYEAVDQITFENAFWRKDIGARALKALK